MPKKQKPKTMPLPRIRLDDGYWKVAIPGGVSKLNLMVYDMAYGFAMRLNREQGRLPAMFRLPK